MDPGVSAGFQPFITYSRCDVGVPMHLLGHHICTPVSITSQPIVQDPEELVMYETSLPAPTLDRSQRPFIPPIDPFAVGTHSGELTPSSSGYDSTVASPQSTGSGPRSPFLHPHRKESGLSIRRPPSPELLSQDCAFPPFPTSKPKKKDTSRSTTRSRTQTPDISNSKGFSHERSRSASSGGSRPRRSDIQESMRVPSSTSRQASVSSRGGSRNGSVDAVPPLPPLQSTASLPTPETEYERQPQLPLLHPGLSTPPTIESQRHEISNSPDQIYYNTSPQRSRYPPRNSSAQSHMIQEVGTHSRQPSYKARRPPPLMNMPSNTKDVSPHHEPQETNVGPPPPTPTSTISRTLTSIFGRKRGLSISSKKSSKPPATDGPRFVALSPDPDPLHVSRQEHVSYDSPSIDSVAVQAVIHEQKSSPSSASHEVQTSQSSTSIPEPSAATLAEYAESDYDDEEEAVDAKPAQRQTQASHDFARDTIQMENDLEKRLAAMGAPVLTVVSEKDEEIRRASIDSASSYGSVGFSRGSASTHSTNRFEFHSHGSSISTYRTTSSSDDPMLSQFPKVDPDAVPDSPTDPLLQHGRLAPVREMISPPQSDKDENDGYFARHKMLTPVPEIVSSPELEKAESPSMLTVPGIVPLPSSTDQQRLPRQRRPSTPGGYRGTCRGCSNKIVSGQKSVSSKDGRLSGKYHKECFVCTDCRQPFATADFYVYNDNPFCAQHYHEHNGTLCESCGHGIEGQYIETSSMSGEAATKFHSDCLRCDTCKIPLHEDYFELAGKVYCEKDAFRLAAGPRPPYTTTPARPSPLNRELVPSADPRQMLMGGRFPERRLTKLMTT